MLNKKIKISIITLLFVVLFTVIKFVFYFISGSQTVLSESFHSFSDAATTLLVLFALYRQQKKSHSKDDDVVSQKKIVFSKLSKFYMAFCSIDSELKVAFLISLSLLALSIRIFIDAFSSNVTEIQNSLSTGIVFILFSFFSYFLSTFQILAAEDENSEALKADALHTRADMLISMMTGVSLLLYYAGFNVDKYFAAGISIYIFLFSLGLLFSSIKQILGFSGSFFIFINDFFTFKLGLSNRFKRSVLNISKLIALIVFASLFYSYLSTAFYTVNADEEALLFRFGFLVNKKEGIKPGLHFCFPWPIDKVVSVKTSSIFSIKVANKSASSGAKIWTKEHGDTTDYISGDNNFFLPYTSVHFKIKNPVKYYLMLRSGMLKSVIENITENVLTLIFSESSFYDISIYKRNEWGEFAKKRVQDELDAIDCGVEVTGFFVNDLHPPVTIASSFENVVASSQIKERYLHMAGRYSTLKLSQARISSFQKVADAEMYKISRVETAVGESNAYLFKLRFYKTGAVIAKDMMMLQTVEKLLFDKKKIIVSPSAVDADLLYYENYVLKRK